MAGTPLGTPEYGKAENQAGTRSAGSFEAFDRTPMVKLMMQQLSGSTGQQQAKALAGASKLGVGRSSGTIGQMANIAADTENRIQGARQQSALDTFREQLGQKRDFDQLANEKYKIDATLYEKEKARRRVLLALLDNFYNSYIGR